MTPEATQVLSRFNAAFCIYELAGHRSPLSVTSDFAYVRLHGPEAGKYQEDMVMIALTSGLVGSKSGPIGCERFSCTSTTIRRAMLFRMPSP